MVSPKYVRPRCRVFQEGETFSLSARAMVVMREVDGMTLISVQDPLGKNRTEIELPGHTLRALGKYLIRQADRIDDTEEGAQDG